MAREPLNGENLYPLRMMDLDDTFVYSSSSIFEGWDLSGYPNPVIEKIGMMILIQHCKVRIGQE